MSASHSFWRATLDTNPDQCNLHCIMCEDHSVYADDWAMRKRQGRIRPMMDVELMEKIIREAADLGIREIIPSTMGEPLLYPGFERLLELCNELGLSVNLTTNGTFPSNVANQSVEYWAERIVPLASDVKISWNGASEVVQGKIMQGTSLSQHTDHAKRFIAVRDRLSAQHYCSMTLQMTFMQINLNEIPGMVRLAAELGFDRVKGHHLWTHFPEMESQSLRSDPVVAEKWNRTVVECEGIVDQFYAETGKTLRLDNFFQLDLSDLGDIAPGGECPFLGREIWVDPTGRFNVCCAPDQQRKALGEFGNVSQDRLQDIILGSEYTDLLANYSDRELCKTCNMRRPS